MFYELEPKEYNATTCPVCGSKNVGDHDLIYCGHYVQDWASCPDCHSDLFFQYYLTGCYVSDEEE